MVRRLPLYVLIVLTWLRDQLTDRRAPKARSRRPIAQSVLRVNAKAEALAVAVGGRSPYYNEEGKIVKERPKWFWVRLSENEAPWAFARGLPSRAISTLELLATTLGLLLLSEPGVAGSLTVMGFADRLVLSSVVTRGLTTAFPSCAVAMELVAQLEARGAELHLDRVPRVPNAEAGALADGRCTSFSDGFRVHANISQVPWLVLDHLLRAGMFFSERGSKVQGQENGVPTEMARASRTEQRKEVEGEGALATGRGALKTGLQVCAPAGQ